MEWDADVVRLRVSPPAPQPWSASFRWDAVTRVCFHAEGPEVSDGIYVFTRGRPEIFAIPTEAAGGAEFWAEVLRRGLFDPELAITAAGASRGLYCWPEPDAAAPIS